MLNTTFKKSEEKIREMKGLRKTESNRDMENLNLQIKKCDICVKGI